MSTAPSTDTPSDAKAPEVKIDQFGVQMKARLVDTINEHNALAARVKAASGDEQSLLETLRENNDSDEAKKITAAIEELDNKREALHAKRDEILKPIAAKMIEDSKAGLGDAEAKAADLLKTINAGKKYLSDLYTEAALADLPDIVGKRRASSGGSGGGTGARRIRGFDVYIDGVLATGRNGKGEQVSNMASAAKILGVETENLRDAFFAAAGTDDSSKYPKEVEFTVTVTEGEGDDAKPVVKTIVAKRVAADEPRATEKAASTEEPAY